MPLINRLFILNVVGFFEKNNYDRFDQRNIFYDNHEFRYQVILEYYLFRYHKIPVKIKTSNKKSQHTDKALILMILRQI